MSGALPQAIVRYCELHSIGYTLLSGSRLIEMSPALVELSMAFGGPDAWWRAVRPARQKVAPRGCPECGNPQYVGFAQAHAVDAHGEPKVFELSFCGHLHNPNDSTEGNLLLVNDITAHSVAVDELFAAHDQLRGSRQRFQQLFDHAADAILLHDMQGRLVEANRMTCSTTGYTRDELLTMHISEIEMTVAPDSVKGIWNRMEIGTPVTAQGVHRRKDGTTFPVEVRLGLFDSDGQTLMLALARDVTERKQAEETLRRLNEELRAARDKEAEANRAKSVFLANMSHELRTPLNAIMGYSEMLAEELDGAVDAAVIDDLRKVHYAGRHLLHLINDILDLSKLEAGKMTLQAESFPVADLVEEVASSLEPVMTKNHNRFHLSIGADVQSMVGDMSKIRHILFNLLSNGGKFTQNGEVTLSVQQFQSDERDWIRFEVQDSGIGMSPEQLSRIFKPFSQVDSSSTRKFGGTGLGLTISRRFAQMHGGEITVRSALGEGSSFTAVLPTRPLTPASADIPFSDARSRTPTSPELQIGAGHTVLVIDDDRAVRDVLSRFLRERGYRILTAETASEGLRKAREQLPSVILLDVILPDSHGWTVLSQLKADERLASIPIVMVTMVDDRETGFALGASDYLTKPIDRQRLVDVLARFGSGSTARRALIVEDDPLTRDLARRVLEGHGWTVATAENGRVGLDTLEIFMPDVVLLDLMMPEMDGFEFLERMRQSPAFDTTPVVVVTARDLSDADLARLQGSVERLLQKGAYGREQLLQEIERQLDRSFPRTV
ncbi:MAG: response regulator [Myxococcales bacterium]|nr:response regulator [Myxococcales bacterium]